MTSASQTQNLIVVIRTVVERYLEELGNQAKMVGHKSDNAAQARLMLNSLPTLLANVGKEVSQLEDDRGMLLQELSDMKAVVSALTKVASELRERLERVLQVNTAFANENKELERKCEETTRHGARLAAVVDLLQPKGEPKNKVIPAAPSVERPGGGPDVVMPLVLPVRAVSIAIQTENVAEERENGSMQRKLDTLQAQIASLQRTLDIARAETAYETDRNKVLDGMVSSLNEIIGTQQAAINQMASASDKRSQDRRAFLRAADMCYRGTTDSHAPTTTRAWRDGTSSTAAYAEEGRERDLALADAGPDGATQYLYEEPDIIPHQNDSVTDSEHPENDSDGAQPGDHDWVEEGHQVTHLDVHVTQLESPRGALPPRSPTFRSAPFKRSTGVRLHSPHT